MSILVMDGVSSGTGRPIFVSNAHNDPGNADDGDEDVGVEVLDVVDNVVMRLLIVVPRSVDVMGSFSLGCLHFLHLGVCSL